MFTYEQIQSLNELELNVYEYVIQNIQKVSTMKIRELADATHVSTTTILRFCTKMGCEGYSEFKLRLKLLPSDEPNYVAQDHTSAMLEFFHKTNTPAFQKKLHDCAELVKNAENIYFLGIGTSGDLGRYGARFFSNIGLYSSSLQDPFYPMPTVDKDHSLLIILSVSGETEMILREIQAYKAHHFKIISITNSDHSTLAKISDEVLSYYMPLEMIGPHYNVTTQVPVIHLIEMLGKKSSSLKNLKHNS